MIVAKNNYDPFKDPMRRTEPVTITPEVAQRLLGQNDPNRPTSRRSVSLIAADIAAGKWVHNGETICLSASGKVLDGRHRLAAVVEADTPIVADVAFGVPEEAFRSYDQGRRRSASDVFGIVGERNCRLLSSVLNLLVLEENGLLHSIHGGTCTTAEITEALGRYPGVREAIHRVTGQYAPSTKLLPPRIAGWCSYRFFEADADLAAEWFDGVNTGAGLDRGSPMLELRNRLISNGKNAKAKILPHEVLALAIKSFNALRRGQPIHNLRWRATGPAPEPFPTLDRPSRSNGRKTLLEAMGV